MKENRLATIIKKDMLEKKANKLDIDTRVFKSFIANSMILKITELKKEDYKDFKKVLKKEKVFDNILADTIPRRIKKVLLKIDPKLYYRKK